MPSVRFITEGDDRIGFGHLARVLVLADAFSRKGYKVVVEPRNQIAKDFLIDKIPAGVALTGKDSCNTDWIAWDVREPLTADEFERESKGANYSLMIDECGNMRTRADVVIDAFMVPYRASTLPESTNTDYLYGLDYFPLNPKCLQYQNEGVLDGNALIAFGGSDPAGLTLPLIEALLRKKYQGSLTVVTGKNHANKQRIEEVGRLLNAEVLDFVDDLPRRISKASLLVTKLGLTTMEAFAIGTPVVLIEPYQFHEEVSTSLAEYYHDWPARNFGIGNQESFNAVADYLNSKPSNTKSGRWKLLDGLGSSRLIDHLTTFLN